MELKDIIPIVISVVSLLFTVYITFRYQNLDEKVKKLELEKHMKSAEDKRKADIEVSVVSDFKNSPKLRFYNKGMAEAYNISFDIPSDLEDKIDLNIREDYLPYPKLLPQQGFDVYYYDFSNKPHHTVVIAWDDQFGKGRRKEMVVDL